MTKTAHIDTFTRDRLPAVETWPEFLFGEHVPKYAEYLNAAEVLLENGFPDNPAIFSGDLCWNYRDLNQKSNNIANILADEYKLKPGNRVLLRG
ncbi:MAG: 2-aminobenzoate-CoA ligase, partial [Emcibacteraceae bacterium]|nr:2-aminobenzoate-CoA ligase [Emcibacteraceae bacterium]